MVLAMLPITSKSPTNVLDRARIASSLRGSDRQQEPDRQHIGNQVAEQNSDPVRYRRAMQVDPHLRRISKCPVPQAGALKGIIDDEQAGEEHEGLPVH